MKKKIDKSDYDEYVKERYRREREIDDLWVEERKLMKKINDLTLELHQDYPETRGEDPGY